MSVLAFDIETVPDTDAGRRILGIDDLDDQAVAKAMFQLQRENSGTTFLRLHLHRIVAISVVLRHGSDIRVRSIAEPQAGEADLIGRFFDGIERYTPTLVSWNGSGFDLPVLHYRSLVHGVPAPHYWESGDAVHEFRFNNYRNRYHDRHTDLMDVLAGFQARATAGLDDFALTLGLPGKLGMHGSAVWDRFCAGEIGAIRDYCETDALNTYLIYLRFQLTRGDLTPAAFRAECERVRDYLSASPEAHWASFLAGWVSLDSWLGPQAD